MAQCLEVFRRNTRDFFYALYQRLLKEVKYQQMKKEKKKEVLNDGKHTRFEEKGYDVSIIQDSIQQYITSFNRPTSELNRKRIAVFLSEAMAEAGAFKSKSLNQELFRMMKYEHDLYHALENTKFSCRPLLEEDPKKFGFVKLVSETWTEKPDPEDELVKQTLKFIEEAIKDGRDTRLHSRTRASGALENQRKAISAPKAGIRPAIPKSF